MCQWVSVDRWIAAWIVLLGACAAPPSPDGDGGPPDAAADGASADVTLRDAIVPDAIVPDAIVPDAIVPDAVAPDAGECDVDLDGHASIACGGDDCDDGAPDRFPGAPELCDGSDDDCDGVPDQEPAASASCATAHGSSSCTAGTCVVASCDAGYHACDGDCASDASPASCGTSCTPCSAPLHATATCDGAACGFECEPGFSPIDDGCDVPVPRPIAPLSSATVTSRRPTLRWELAAGTDGARVDLCRDRACAMVVTTIDAVGTSATPSSDLPAGVVFWRLHGRVGAATGTAVSPTWQLTVGRATAPIDTSWGTTLDANGDGYADVLVGAYGVHDPATSMPVGAAYLYAGSATGVRAGPTVTLASLDGADSAFGRSVASAGDVDGDGYTDVIVGADGAMSNTGTVHLYRGGPGGLETTPATSLVGPDGPNGTFGAMVTSAGDVNRDGYADVAIGAPGVTSGSGNAYVYLGSATGLAATPARTLFAPSAASSFGLSIASGDWNGDGYSDLAFGAYAYSNNTGRVYVHLGSAAGLVLTPARVLTGPDGFNGYFGRSIADGGDVNGDGRADLVVSGWTSLGGSSARTYLGQPGGVSTLAITRIVGPSGGACCGFSVGGAGDLDGDGYADLVLGNRNVSTVTIFSGGTAGPLPPATTTLTVAGTDRLGSAVSSAGDVNGDGHLDVIVGAHNTTGVGTAYVYLGSATGLVTPAATTLTAADRRGFGASVE